MLLDVDVLEARKTISDHYGVYHSYQASENQYRSFLMFSCSLRREALHFGEELAKILKVPFRDRLPAISEREQQEEDRREAEKVTVPPTDPDEFALYIIRHGTVGPVTTSASKPAAAGKKVMGVGSRIRELLAQGLNDSDIVEQCIPMYTSAGKTETVARNLLKPYVAEIRKLEAKKKGQ